MSGLWDLSGNSAGYPPERKGTLGAAPAPRWRPDPPERRRRGLPLLRVRPGIAGRIGRSRIWRVGLSLDRRGLLHCLLALRRLLLGRRPHRLEFGIDRIGLQ